MWSRVFLPHHQYARNIHQNFRVRSVDCCTLDSPLTKLVCKCDAKLDFLAIELVCEFSQTYRFRKTFNLKKYVVLLVERIKINSAGDIKSKFFIYFTCQFDYLTFSVCVTLSPRYFFSAFVTALISVHKKWFLVRRTILSMCKSPVYISRTFFGGNSLARYRASSLLIEIKYLLPLLLFSAFGKNRSDMQEHNYRIPTILSRYRNADKPWCNAGL